MRTEYHLSTSHWQSLSHCNTTIVVVVIVVAGASCCGNLLWLSPSCTDAGPSGWCVPAVAQLGGGTSANLGLAPGELVATTGLTTLLHCPLPTTPSINSPLISTLWLLYMDKNWYYDFGVAFKWPLIYKQTKLFELNIEWHCTVVLFGPTNGNNIKFHEIECLGI